MKELPVIVFVCVGVGFSRRGLLDHRFARGIVEKHSMENPIHLVSCNSKEELIQLLSLKLQKIGNTIKED